MSSWKHEYS